MTLYPRKRAGKTRAVNDRPYFTFTTPDGKKKVRILPEYPLFFLRGYDTIYLRHKLNTIMPVREPFFIGKNVFSAFAVL